MKRMVYFIILLIVGIIVVGVVLTHNKHKMQQSEPPLPSEVWASYNVTGSGEFSVNVSGNWSMAGIAVIYTPAFVKGGYVTFISPSGAEIDNFTLTHEKGVTTSVSSCGLYNAGFYHLGGQCRIKYHIEGSSTVTIQLRYKS